MRILFTFILISIALVVKSQEHHQPQRTAADIARKQTEMLVRELHITDSAMRDTLFRMHLKYANRRINNCTRAEALQIMLQMQEELKNILTAEQFESFINHRIDQRPRSPQNPCNWIAPSLQGNPAPLPSGATHTPPPPQ